MAASSRAGLSDIEPNGQQAELDEMKEKMKGLELEMAAQKAL